MSDPVSLSEAKLFLRVDHPEEDALILILLDAVKVQIEARISQVLNDASPAPLRLCVLFGLAQAYHNRGVGSLNLDGVEGLLRAYQGARL